MIDNISLAFADYEASEDKPFVIDDDAKAEWALLKIAEERAETQRLKNVCQTYINEYQAKIKRLDEQLASKTGYLISLLNKYFETVDHKKSKTQETYQLPSGKLKLKLPTTEYVRDDEKLVGWLESNNWSGFVKVKKSPDWSSLKDEIKKGELEVHGDKVFDTNTGSYVDGVTITERPAIFEVEV